MKDEDFKRTYLTELQRLMHSYMSMKAQIGNAMEKQGCDMDSRTLVPVNPSLDPVIERLLSLVNTIDAHLKEGRLQCKARNIPIPEFIPFVESEMAIVRAAVRRTSSAH
jgi:hypothetical protein